MVMPNGYEGESGGDVLERGASGEDTTDLQQQQQQGPSLEDRIAAILDARLTPLERRVQSFTDRTANTLAGMEQRIEALRGEVGATPEIRDMLADLHELTLDADVRKQRLLERQIARMERQQGQQPAPPAAPPQQAPVEAEGDWDSHVPDLVRYAQTRGFAEADITAPGWMDRLHAAGLPHEGFDLTPRGIRAYKDAIYAAIDRLAQQQAAQRRPRTVTPNPVTAGSGPRNYSNLQSVRDIPDQEFENNFAAIARAVVAKHRR